MKYEYWFANIKGISNKRKIEIRDKFRRIKELFYMEESKMASLDIKENEQKGKQIQQIQKKRNEKMYKISCELNN